jgi:hypothetical protein
MKARNSQYRGGSGTNPRVFARGETVRQAPTAIMITEVRMSGRIESEVVEVGGEAQVIVLLRGQLLLKDGWASRRRISD